jgi:tetratricopeptide (TPR) repeat protein
MHLPSPDYREGTHRTLFYAQSWIVMHYLLSKQMLGQVGTYFDLVQNQAVPVDRAMTQAFGMNPEQFEKAVKDYFQMLTPLFVAQDQANLPDTRNNGPQTGQFPAPVGPDDVTMVVNKLTDDDGHAMVAEVMARQPEHREQGLKELEALAQEPADNENAHRALAYIHILKKEFKPAADEVAACIDIDPKDRWPRYYNALLKFRMAQTTGQPIEGGLANVQQGLREVIDWYPDFAEAFHMLGLAEMQGGGMNAALDSLRNAIRLSPRNEWYVMHLADAYLAGKRWQNGQDILEHLKTSGNPQIASMAKKKLNDLPFLKKFGMYPEAAAEVKAREAAEATAETKNNEEDSADTGEPKLKQRTPDKRPVQYAKGKIVSVDCTKAPAAVVTITAAGRILKLHTSDYKTVALVGTDDFSCEWRSQAASVNYKSTTKSEGDLVSVEVQ